MGMGRETFHVYCRVGRGQHYIVLMARDHADAKARAEANGHVVIKVRRAPSR